MLNRLRRARTEYPRQFWLMFWGMLVSTTGASMVWPFLMIYVSERLSLPLTATASLITLSSTMGLISSFLVGPVIDRLGRKWTMALSLLLNAGGYLILSQANTFALVAVAMALNGTVNPLYRVGADAMLADLIPAEKRPDAYSLIRMSNNLGVAIGPLLGGLAASLSYSAAFFGAAAGLSFYGLLVALRAVETLPEHVREARVPEKLGGYLEILRDGRFMSFVGAFALVQVCSALIWVLGAVYMKQNFGIGERQYSLLPTTNALMVVFAQFLVTQVTKRYKTLPVLAVGAFFYASATLGYGLATGFWAFWAAMAWMTIGELVIMPTSSTYAANLAPADKRGRYMSLYGLTWGAASAVGPVIGGLLNDRVGPQFIWYGGALVGAVALAAFALLALRSAAARPAPENATR